jgi:prepilin-type N-terminal cleavage/methylation domain-containing protein
VGRAKSEGRWWTIAAWRSAHISYYFRAMKKLSSMGAVRAFTLVELLVVIAIIAIMVALTLPQLSDGDRSPNFACMNNLKQNDLGFIMWAYDHQDQFPWQVSVTNGGTMELVSSGHAFPHFQSLSNYLRQTQMLVCPTDKAKKIATGFAELSDTNISYFINLDAGYNTNPPLTAPSLMVLAGDRHLEANGQPVKPGLFLFTTNLSMGWTHELHNYNKNAPVGVLAFTDGHVEAAVTKGLSAIFQRQCLATNRLVVP